MTNVEYFPFGIMNLWISGLKIPFWLLKVKMVCHSSHKTQGKIRYYGFLKVNKYKNTPVFQMALWRKNEWIQEIQQSPISNINVFLVSANKTLFYKPKITKINITFSGAVLFDFVCVGILCTVLLTKVF